LRFAITLFVVIITTPPAAADPYIAAFELNKYFYTFNILWIYIYQPVGSITS
jgi:hypothetical protein